MCERADRDIEKTQREREREREKDGEREKGDSCSVLMKQLKLSRKQLLFPPSLQRFRQYVRNEQSKPK